MDLVSKFILGIIGILLAVVGWFTKTKIGSIEEAIKKVAGDLEIVQDRLLDLDKRAMRDETRVEGVMDDVKRIERDMGQIDGSLGKLHQRVDEVKDLVYKKTER